MTEIANDIIGADLGFVLAMVIMVFVLAIGDGPAFMEAA